MKKVFLAIFVIAWLCILKLIIDNYDRIVNALRQKWESHEICNNQTRIVALSEPQDEQRGISVMLVALRWDFSPLFRRQLRDRAAKAVRVVDQQFDKDVMDVKILEVNESKQYVQLSVRANFRDQKEQEKIRDALKKEFIT